jgi:hypothetical protein
MLISLSKHGVLRKTTLLFFFPAKRKLQSCRITKGGLLSTNWYLKLKASYPFGQVVLAMLILTA